MGGVELVREAWSGVLDLVYPPRCLVCREYGPEAICEDCRANFQAPTPPLCDRCGDMIPARPTGLCSDCDRGTYYFLRARAAGQYDGALRQAIVNFKYGGKRRLAQPLGRYLADFLLSRPFNQTIPEVIVPVPLHPIRLRERGFNQSTLLAAEVGRQLGVPLEEGALQRTRNTRHQAGLKEAERLRNVRDAFAAQNPGLVAGKTVLLLDDVLTTLHTADECARVLSGAGAKAVLVVGVARGL